MGVSKKFIESFSSLVKQYNLSGVGTYIRKKDLHYEQISPTLNALIDVIETNQDNDALSDISLIHFLSVSAMMLLLSDYNFALAISGFVRDCREKKLFISPTIEAGLDFDSSQPLSLIQQLHSGIKRLHSVLEDTRSIHQKEIDVYKIQVDELIQTNDSLRKEVDALSRQLDNQQSVKEQIVKLERAKHLVQELGGLAGLPTIPDISSMSVQKPSSASPELVASNLSNSPIDDRIIVLEPKKLDLPSKSAQNSSPRSVATPPNDVQIIVSAPNPSSIPKPPEPPLKPPPPQVRANPANKINFFDELQQRVKSSQARRAEATNQDGAQNVDDSKKKVQLNQR